MSHPRPSQPRRSFPLRAPKSLWLPCVVVLLASCGEDYASWVRRLQEGSQAPSRTSASKRTEQGSQNGAASSSVGRGSAGRGSVDAASGEDGAFGIARGTPTFEAVGLETQGTLPRLLREDDAGNALARGRYLGSDYAFDVSVGVRLQARARDLPVDRLDFRMGLADGSRSAFLGRIHFWRPRNPALRASARGGEPTHWEPRSLPKREGGTLEGESYPIGEVFVSGRLADAPWESVMPALARSGLRAEEAALLMFEDLRRPEGDEARFSALAVIKPRSRAFVRREFNPVDAPFSAQRLAWALPNGLSDVVPNVFVLPREVRLSPRESLRAPGASLEGHVPSARFPQDVSWKAIRSPGTEGSEKHAILLSLTLRPRASAAVRYRVFEALPHAEGTLRAHFVDEGVLEPGRTRISRFAPRERAIVVVALEDEAVGLFAASPSPPVSSRTRPQGPKGPLAPLKETLARTTGRPFLY